MNDRYPLIQARTPLGDANRSVLDKLVKDTTTPGANNVNRHYIMTDPLALNRISRNTAQNVIDSDAIMQVLPEMEHVVQILVGTILNPKDMSNTDLNIVVDNSAFSSELNRVLLEVVTDYFKNDYKMGDRLEKVLEDIVARKGAYIQAILPENALDLIINGERKISNEDFNGYVEKFKQGRPLGILGAADLPESMEGKGLKAETISIEDFDPNTQELLQTVGFADSYLTVSDNFHLLKTRELNKVRQRSVVNSLIKRDIASMEDSRSSNKVGLTPEQIEELYRRSDQRYQQTVIVEKPDFIERPSMGHPLVIDLDPAAVIPVYIPGKPHEHVGYFVLIDNFGRPVVSDTNSDYYNDLKNDFNKRYGSRDNSSELLRITRDAMGASNEGQNTYEIEQVHQGYNSIMEADLKKRLFNGSYREDFDIGFTDEIRRIMFSRHLKKQNTRLVYVPAELMVYDAFYYDHNGVGLSMLARSKVLANMRSVLLFAETMAGVRNAVGRKKVNINLDPNDPDKNATVAEAQQLILESGLNAFPLGAPDPTYTLDYLNRAGYDFSINANSEDYHQMSVEYDDYNTNIQAGNPELQDRLRKMHISSMSVPPEKADPENGAEFATSIVHNDLLFARRVKSMQKAFADGRTKFIRVYCLNSSIIVNKMLDKVKENPNMIPEEYKGQPGTTLVEDFINALNVKLPEPDTSRTQLMIEMLEQHSQLLDKVLESYITTDLFPEEYFIKGGSVEKAIPVIKAHFMRMYIQNNGILPQVGVLYEMEEGKPVFSLLDSQTTAFESLGVVIQNFAHRMEEIRTEWQKKYVDRSDESGGMGGDMDDSFSGGPDDDFGMSVDDTPPGDDLEPEPEPGADEVSSTEPAKEEDESPTNADEEEEPKL